MCLHPHLWVGIARNESPCWRLSENWAPIRRLGTTRAWLGASPPGRSSGQKELLERRLAAVHLTGVGPDAAAIADVRAPFGIGDLQRPQKASTFGSNLGAATPIARPRQIACRTRPRVHSQSGCFRSAVHLIAAGAWVASTKIDILAQAANQWASVLNSRHPPVRYPHRRARQAGIQGASEVVDFESAPLD